MRPTKPLNKPGEVRETVTYHFLLKYRSDVSVRGTLLINGQTFLGGGPPFLVMVGWRIRTFVGGGSTFWVSKRRTFSGKGQRSSKGKEMKIRSNIFWRGARQFIFCLGKTPLPHPKKLHKTGLWEASHGGI